MERLIRIYSPSTSIIIASPLATTKIRAEIPIAPQLIGDVVLITYSIVVFFKIYPTKTLPTVRRNLLVKVRKIGLITLEVLD